MSHTPPYLVVSGPTGSGKTALAIRLARALGGEVVNADSVQLYRDHLIGAAMPSAQELNVVPHHLFGVLDGDTVFDIQQYVTIAAEKAEEIRARGNVPIFSGGSTLYLERLMEGLSELPPRDDALRRELEELSTEELWGRLVDCDLTRANELHKNDRVRILRALEVFLLRGVPYSTLSKHRRASLLPGHAIIVLPIWPRDLLYRRIEARSAEMIERGLVNETAKLLTQYGEEWQCRSAVGYQQVAQALEVYESDQERDNLIESISQATRRYAKRQMTYWRHAPKKFGWDEAFFSESEDEVQIVLRGEESGHEQRGVSRREKRKGVSTVVAPFSLLIERLRCALSRPTEKHRVCFLDGESLVEAST
jgi:tRNA dimethylallyltransferase